MKKEFLKRMIYEKEKDKSFRSSNYFYSYISRKYNIKAVKAEYGDLYRMILRYQIKKYGKSLTYIDYSIGDKGQDIARTKAKEVYNQRKTKKININNGLKVYEEVLKGSDSND